LEEIIMGLSELNLADLELVGPESPTGQYLRRFWQPLMRSKEILPGRARAAKILGEEFTVYRGEDGNPHVVAYRCAHRACPLTVGWVEGDSIRCRYHGWKFDASGRCIEKPNEDDGPTEHRIRIPIYPSREYAGLIFAYLGRDNPPPFPQYPDLDRPGVILTDPVEVLPCSFWNRFDNDHSHIPWVHRATAYRTGRKDLLLLREEAVEETAYGWTGRRSVKGEKSGNGNSLGIGRLTHFFMPNIRLFWAPTRAKGFENANLWDTKVVWTVPIDDASHAAFDVTHTPIEGEDGRRYAESRSAQQEAEAETRWDLAESVLKGDLTLEDLPDDMGAYTSFAIEDYVTQVGQGSLAGRREALSGSDGRLVVMRRLWLREVNAMMSGKPLTQWKIPEHPLSLATAAVE
jgi:5,5'-dehydrodivanillate O-demethylase oxygenase subunit